MLRLGFAASTTILWISKGTINAFIKALKSVASLIALLELEGNYRFQGIHVKTTSYSMILCFTLGMSSRTSSSLELHKVSLPRWVAPFFTKLLFIMAESFFLTQRLLEFVQKWFLPTEVITFRLASSLLGNTHAALMNLCYPKSFNKSLDSELFQ